MMNIAKFETQASMTLKEITDLLEVRHSNAMRTVATMAGSPEFGEVLKISSSYTNNIGAELKLETYSLNKRQSIAVAARLNTSLMMRIIDRWQELEEQIPSNLHIPDFTNPVLAARAWADEVEKKQQALAKIEEDKPKVFFVDNLVQREALLTATQVGQKVGLSAVTLNKHLDSIGGVYNQGVKRSRVFTKDWIEKGFGELKQTERGYDQSLFTNAGEVEVVKMLVSEGIIGN